MKADRATPSRSEGCDWTQGLRTRTANALRAAGFTGRDQVETCSERRLRRVHNLGRTSLDDLYRWLGRLPT